MEIYFSSWWNVIVQYKTGNGGIFKNVTNAFKDFVAEAKNKIVNTAKVAGLASLIILGGANVAQAQNKIITDFQNVENYFFVYVKINC